MRLPSFFFLLVLVLSAIPARPLTVHATESEFRAQVLTVRTCDEVVVRRKSKIMAVRISGIDCPVAKQPLAAEAKAFVAALVNGRTITLKQRGHDRQRRVWADVFLDDGRSVAYEMVKAGWARVSATLIDERLSELEDTARRAKRGLWKESPVSTPQPAANGATSNR